MINLKIAKQIGHSAECAGEDGPGNPVREIRRQKSAVRSRRPISDFRLLIPILCALLFALCVPATAQQAAKVLRIGVLSPFSLDPNLISPPIFRQALRELGWIDGKNISIEYRYAGGQNDRLPELAADLVRNKVDVIVAGPDNYATIAATGATTTIPIIMVGVVDPVAIGLVSSLARPGANVSGLAWEVTREQAGKNLELLKEAVPKLSRVAILRKPDDLTHVVYSKVAERAAKVLGITLRFAEVQARNDKGLKHALDSIVNEHANGLLVTPDSFFSDRRQQIVDFAARQKLPAIYFAVGFVSVGGLMSYGPDQEHMWQRAADYVDKILKGTRPADLPVEQPKKFHLLINLKTAKQIGLTIPPNVLTRADRVIR